LDVEIFVIIYNKQHVLGSYHVRYAHPYSDTQLLLAVCVCIVVFTIDLTRAIFSTEHIYFFHLLGHFNVVSL
jgi:hypothetical protein